MYHGRRDHKDLRTEPRSGDTVKTRLSEEIPLKGVARIFNSAVMPYGDAFIGVFRGEQTNGIPYIYLGHSKDAIHWDFEENKIPFVDENGEPFMPIYAYDPRLVKSRRHLLYHLVSGFLRSSNRHGKNNRFQDVYTD